MEFDDYCKFITWQKQLNVITEWFRQAIIELFVKGIHNQHDIHRLFRILNRKYLTYIVALFAVNRNSIVCICGKASSAPNIPWICLWQKATWSWFPNGYYHCPCFGLLEIKKITHHLSFSKFVHERHKQWRRFFPLKSSHLFIAIGRRRRSSRLKGNIF